MLLPAFQSFAIDKREGLSLGLSATENGDPLRMADYVFTLRVFSEADGATIFSVDAIATDEHEGVFLQPIVTAPDQRAQHEISALRLADNCTRVLVEGHCSIY